jgi:hypothetical protein
MLRFAMNYSKEKKKSNRIKSKNKISYRQAIVCLSTIFDHVTLSYDVSI